MDAVCRFAKRLRSNADYKFPEAIEPIFALFRTGPDASYATRKISEHVTVPISIFDSWHEKIRADPD
jgi:hypothetical protein